MFSIKNLDVYYGQNQVLKNVSLEVKEREFVGLLGPNGSGKSTLIKAIARTVPYKSGNIFIKNEEISTIPLKKSAQIFSVLWQEKVNAFDFTVYDMVMLGRTPYKKLMESENKEDIEITNIALKKLGLENYKDKLLSELSGGESQRVFLARAFAQNTEAFLLDEPTNHLDISHQLKLLHTIKKENKTTLVALHDLNLALTFCDKVYVLKDGEIVASGDPEKVLNSKLLKEIYNINAELVKNPLTNKYNLVYAY